VLEAAGSLLDGQVKKGPKGRLRYTPAAVVTPLQKCYVLISDLVADNRHSSVKER